MCIGSNSVNQAQDLISVTKFEDFPNSLLPIGHGFSKYCTNFCEFSLTALLVVLMQDR